MLQNKVYLTIGRHAHYGMGDTAILRADMLTAYQTGCLLRQILPPCAAVYHSPLERAAETAKFQALAMQCQHLLESDALREDAPKFTTRQLINNILASADETVQYYHFVTHLPVVEKLGLPFLGAGDWHLLTADSWQNMLSNNYTVQTVQASYNDVSLWQKIGQTPDSLEKLSSAQIYKLLADI